MGCISFLVFPFIFQQNFSHGTYVASSQQVHTATFPCNKVFLCFSKNKYNYQSKKKECLTVFLYFFFFLTILYAEYKVKRIWISLNWDWMMFTYLYVEREGPTRIHFTSEPQTTCYVRAFLWDSCVGHRFLLTMLSGCMCTYCYQVLASSVVIVIQKGGLDHKRLFVLLYYVVTFCHTRI